MKHLLPLVVLFAAFSTQAAETQRTTASGVFTTDQAKRGRDIYMLNCAAACHVENLSGNGPAPNLAGPEFLMRWEDFSLEELFNLIASTMPKASPGILSSDEYRDVIAFLLQANGFPAGAAPLASGLGNIKIAPKK